MKRRYSFFLSALTLIGNVWGAQVSIDDLDSIVIPSKSIPAPEAEITASTFASANVILGTSTEADAQVNSADKMITAEKAIARTPLLLPSGENDSNKLELSTSTNTDSHKISNEESKPLNLDQKEDLKAFPEEAQAATTTVYLTLFIVSIAFLVIWYKKQIRGKLKPNRGLPIQTLGQTWLDGQTKVIVLRIGAKVLILAKSQQFCNTLDVISDAEEVNRLTLGSGALDGDEDFSAVLKEMKKQEFKSAPKTIENSPTEEQIRSDLEELKKQLGNMGNKSK